MKYFLFCFLMFVSTSFAKRAVIATFDDMAADQFPKGWGIKKGFWYTSGEGNKTWRVFSERGNKFLRATSKNDSYTVGKKYKYNLEKFKMLSWKWRVHQLPKGGHEGQKDKGDSAAGVYVVFPGFMIPYSIKYVWSATQAVGSQFDSPFTSRTKVIVIRSGTEGVGQWVEEKRNVYNDYLKVFKKETVDKMPEVIALLSDSDNTKTEAKADYDDIYVEDGQ